MRSNLTAGLCAFLFMAIFGFCSYTVAAKGQTMPGVPNSRTVSKVSRVALNDVGISSVSFTRANQIKAASASYTEPFKNADTVLSSIATLSNLSISSGSLSPIFDPGTNSYTGSVTNDITSITITPVVSDATASVTVNGTTVTSGSASGSVQLIVGSNAISVEVMAGDGVTTNTYNITINRAPSPNAALSNLSISSGSLAPVFDPGTNNYTASVTNDITSITLTPVVSDATASVAVNGTAVNSGSPSGPVQLIVGSNVISVTVTAGDGVTTNTYTVTINRAASTNATLSTLSISSSSLSPSFDPGINSYTASVTNDITSIMITPVVSDATASVAVNGIAVNSAAASGPVSLAVGSNLINITVTAGDGVTTNSYTINVSRAVSTNAGLGNLILSTGVLAPGFTTATTNYTVNVPAISASIILTPSTSDPAATLSVNGNVLTFGTAAPAINLNTGANIITIVVTAQDGVTSQTYTIKVTRAPSINASLASMNPSVGPLTPAFLPGTLSYALNVSNATASMTVKPITVDANATIKVNGVTVTPGTISQAVVLTEGAATLITTVVTAQDGITTKTYTITVTRAPSGDASLSAINLNNGTLNPAFGAGTFNYTTSLPNTVSALSITPTTTDANATIVINGAPVASGAASAPVALSVGPNTITIGVTAQNSIATKTYTITATRAPSSDASLANLSLSNGNLSPVFDPGTNGYTASVTNDISSITLTPVVSEATALVTINGTTVNSGAASGPVQLVAGSNTISVTVTAGDGITTNTYTVTINRAASSNATLSTLSISSGSLSPVFDPGTTSYTASVTNDISSITLTPVVSEATASVTINGTTVNSGSASGPVQLAVGSNTISVTVTAGDGITTNTYTVTINRAASTNATLSNLSISSGSLSPVFDPGTTSYTASVSYDNSSITLTPVVSEATASVTINGTTVNSGSASGPVQLAVGSNTISVTVTAGDGITTNTYTITISRAVSTHANLASLSISSGALSPIFAADSLNYTASVDNSIDSIAIVPLAADPNASIAVNGITVTPGSGSVVMALAVGVNSITIFVAAPDGITTKTYTVLITRRLSSDAALAGLSSSVGLNPAFESDITIYTSSVNIIKKDHLVYTIGESLTANGEYQIDLASLLSHTFRFVNFGISGEKTAGMLAGFSTTINAAPDYTIIMGGVDDIRNNVSAVTVESNLQSMYTAAHNAGIKVIALTITPFKGSVKFVPAMEAVQDSVNAWIRTASNVDYVIDTYQGLVNPSNPYQLLPQYDGGDHLHPNKTGEDKIAQLIYAGAVFAPNPLVDQSNAVSTSITVTPLASNADASITINGQSAMAGSASALIPLSVGSNTITTRVTAQDGATSKTYNLNITGAPSNIAKLADLYITNGTLTLNPFFSPDSTNYTASVPFDTLTVKIRPTLTDITAMCSLNGVPIASGTLTNAINLNVGLNTFTIVVTAADGITSKTYTLYLTRLLSTNPQLADLQLSNGLILSPAFSSGIFKFSAQATGAVNSVQITPVTSDAGATVTVNGQTVASGSQSQVIPLTLAQNVITIITTAADGIKSERYTLSIFGVINNASLKSLKMTGAGISPVFKVTTTGYTANVGNAITSTSITPTAVDSTATIKVNNSIVASGSSSSTIPLAVGANIITIAITGSDQVTTQTYTITVTRAPSTNAGLGRLILSAGALTPVFASATTTYTANVTATTSSITLTPSTSDPAATLTLNGNTLASGTTSPAINLNTGLNIITIVVTAQDAATTKTYTVTVSRSPSVNANLASINPSISPLIPAFLPGTTGYALNVSNATSSMSVRPIASDPTATIAVNGIPLTPGTASGPIALAEGAQTAITIVVTAQDGITVKTYTITVTRTASADASLSSFKLSSGTLNPVFSSGVTSYTAGVSNSVSTVVITPASTDAKAAIKVNGVLVASGTASGAFALNVGPNIITAVVTAQDGATTKTYTLTVTRTPSANANLASIGPGVGSLTPAFTPATTSYALNVSNATAFMTVKPVANDPNATIKVNGISVLSGIVSGPVALAEGAATPINLVVTAQDGITTKTYTITATRAPSTDASLSSLQPGAGALSPLFNAVITGYTDTVPDTVSTIMITPIVNDANATIKVNGSTVVPGTASGPIALSRNAPTIITTVVTAQDGATTKTYTVTIPRGPSTVASLSNIQLSTGTLSPAFANGTAVYTASVPNTTSTISIIPAASDANATIKVNGTLVSSRTPSGAIGLNVGPNIIMAVVTAQDGTTTQAYTLTVTRALSANANLAGIGPSITPLAPAFLPGTTSYALATSNATASMTVKPVTSDPNATVKVNGTSVASGSVSGAIALAEGTPTVINMVVTAQDGKTSKTYTLTVNRAPSTDASLTAMNLSTGTLNPVFAAGTVNYTAAMPNTASAISITPTATDLNATIAINGTVVSSGATVGPVALNVGANIITMIVTAQDGTTKETYAVTVTRAPSINANLASISPSITPLSPAFAPATTSYALSVKNSVSSITVKPVTGEPNATVKVNGTALASGTISGPVALAVGPNTVSIAVTAQDGATTKTYTITVTRASGAADAYDPAVGVNKPTETPILAGDGIFVHQGLSPNGDGINDFLLIENISRYPENKLSVMTRDGQLVYESKGYDNSSKVFDGHSSKNGQMQLPGTYFYQLDYTVKGITKHKTGFIVLKY